MKDHKRDQIIQALKKGLSSLDIELTRRCNNNCIHCYINRPLHSKQEEKKEMNTVFIKRIIDEAYHLGLMHCLLTGGEPLIRSDFVELYTYIRQKGIWVTVATNGVLIDTTIMSVFKKFPPKCVNFSLYGFSRASYARVAGVDNYQKARKNLLLLHKNKITLFVKMPVFEFNMKEMQQNKKWITTLSGTKPGWIFDLFCRGYHDDKKKDSHIRRLRLSSESKLRIGLWDEEKYRKEKRKFFSSLLEAPANDYLFGCAAAKYHGAVDAYGYLQPCMSVRSPLARYDLKAGSLYDGVNNFFPQILKMKAHDRRYLERCRNCVLSNFCESCPGNSFSEYGVLDRPVEFLCRWAHHEARFLGILKENQFGWEVKISKKKHKKILNGIYQEQTL